MKKNDNFKKYVKYKINNILDCHKVYVEILKEMEKHNGDRFRILYLVKRLQCATIYLKSEYQKLTNKCLQNYEIDFVD